MNYKPDDPLSKAAIGIEIDNSGITIKFAALKAIIIAVICIGQEILLYDLYGKMLSFTITTFSLSVDTLLYSGLQLLIARTMSMAIMFVLLLLFFGKILPYKGSMNIGLIKKPIWILLLALIAGIALGYAHNDYTFFQKKWRIRPEEHSLLFQLMFNGGITYLIHNILGLLIAPIYEEFLFRGVILAGITRTFNKYVAVIVGTIVFVLLHIRFPYEYNPGYFSITVFSLLAYLARIKLKSILPCIIMHFGWNLYVTIAYWVVYVNGPGFPGG